MFEVVRLALFIVIDSQHVLPLVRRRDCFLLFQALLSLLQLLVLDLEVLQVKLDLILTLTFVPVSIETSVKLGPLLGEHSPALDVVEKSHLAVRTDQLGRDFSVDLRDLLSLLLRLICQVLNIDIVRRFNLPVALARAVLEPSEAEHLTLVSLRLEVIFLVCFHLRSKVVTLLIRLESLDFHLLLPDILERDLTFKVLIDDLDVLLRVQL